MPNPQKKKRSVIYPSLHDVLERWQCHPAAAEGAKLSKCAAANALLGRHRRVGSPLRVLLSLGFTSVLYILHLTLCAKAMHNISAYIEPCMTSKKSFGNPQIPLSPGPVFRCFQKIAKTRGFDPIFQKIVHFPLPPDNTFPCRRPQFFGGGFLRFFLL